MPFRAVGWNGILFCHNFAMHDFAMKEDYNPAEADNFMDIALAEARAAALEDEIPVGAVVVKDGTIISKGRNSNRSGLNPTRHAEMNAIEDAARILANERLTGCDIYITKEPCAMCAGAIVHARIERVFIGACDSRFGACGGALHVCGNAVLNHVPVIVFGIRQDECLFILGEFFRKKRLEKKNISGKVF
jgi:tRNA(adenine34) deaminase